MSSENDHKANSFNAAKFQEKLKFRTKLSDLFALKTADKFQYHVQSILKLTVSGKWLTKHLTSLSTQKLFNMKLVDEKQKQIKLLPSLVHTLIKFLAIEFKSGSETLVFDVKLFHSLEMLGIIVENVLSRPFLQFSRDILPLLFDSSNINTDLFILMTTISDILKINPEESSHFYLQLLSLGVVNSLINSCKYSSYNYLISVILSPQYFCLISEPLISCCEGFTKMQEISVSVLSTLLNYHKLENVNPIEAQFEEASVYELHAIFYGLEILLHRVNKEIKKTIEHNDLLESSNPLLSLVIRGKVALGSFLNANGNVGNGVEFSVGHLGSAADASLLNVIIKGSAKLFNVNNIKPKTELNLSFSLLFVHQLLSSRAGEKVLEEVLLHEVAPWIPKPSKKQMKFSMSFPGFSEPGIKPTDEEEVLIPVECPRLFLYLLSSVSFALFSGNPCLHIIGLNILLFLLENSKCLELVFCSSFENIIDVANADIYLPRYYADEEGNEKYKIYGTPAKSLLLSASNKKEENFSALSFMENAIKSVVGQSDETKQETRVEQPMALAGVVHNLISQSLVFFLKTHVDKDVFFEQSIQKHYGVIQRLVVYENFYLSPFEIKKIDIDWNLTSYSIIKSLKAWSDFDLTLDSFQKSLATGIHLIDMILTMRDDTERSRIYARILLERALFEKILLQESASDSCQQLNDGISRMTAISKKLEKVLALVQAEDLGGQEMLSDNLIKVVGENSKNFDFNPHNRLYDGFTDFVESHEDGLILKTFQRKLLENQLGIRPFSTLLKR
eukprot:snap_masked-scaffold_4-processed-gene-15.6-mRNA-1 protein AED:1.00 eAED:1.00 QI:0/-1/0/0/-1/1/1/0/787